MSNLSSILKKRRRELGLTLAQIADRMGVAEATVQRWESGNIKTVRQDKLGRLAEILGVTPAVLMGWDEASPGAVSAGEDGGRTIPFDLLEIDARLNEQGHAEWVNYGSFLAEQPDYQRPAGTRRSTIRHYLVPAAAGYASPVDGEDYELIELDNVPPGADFCVTVDGDSMEPYIKDGSLVFVKRNADLSDFDVGVFYLDGDVLIKQAVTDSFRNVYLLSANPLREDANRTIRHDCDSALVCFGKVLINKLPQPVYQ